MATGSSKMQQQGTGPVVPNESTSRVIADWRRDSAPPPSAARASTNGAPSYVGLLEEKLGTLLVPSTDARVAHLRCLSGLAADLVGEVLPGAHLVGIDDNEAAIAVARRQAAGGGPILADYRVGSPLATGLPTGAFTHAFTVRGPLVEGERGALLAELTRLLAAGGQAVVVMPMRGSFPEVFDLLLELALKRDAPAVAAAVEKAIVALPTAEGLASAMEDAGLGFVDVALDEVCLTYASGRAFFEDPATRGLVRPELVRLLGPDVPGDAFTYVAMAIDRYFSDLPFTMTVRLAGATARR